MAFKPFFLIVAMFLLTGIVAKAQTAPAFSANHIKAAEAFLDASGIENQLTASYSSMIDASSAQVPQEKKAKFKEIMMAFLSKYMNYAALKPDLTKIYAQEFTEADLKQIAQFYASPAGKKYSQKTAVLLQKSMALGQQKVQAHMGELQENIKAAFPQ